MVKALEGQSDRKIWQSLHNTKVLGNGENEQTNEQQNLNDASDGVVGHR